MNRWENKQKGFTIVELLIVVVVIAILAAITIVAYNGIQERANFASAQSNLKSINTAVQSYHAVNGTYPATGGWRYSCATGINNFIPELSSVASSLPQAPCKDSSSTSNATWIYSSNGTGYKLIHIRPNFSDAIKNSVPVNQRDTRWAASAGTWGYWTGDYVGL